MGRIEKEVNFFHFFLRTQNFLCGCTTVYPHNYFNLSCYLNKENVIPVEHRNNDGSRYWIYRSDISNGSESYALSPINTAGTSETKHVSNVGSTRRTSCRDALTIKTPTGLPRFSVLATSFVPLPHFVLPTQAPLFSQEQTSHQCSTHSRVI